MITKHESAASLYELNMLCCSPSGLEGEDSAVCAETWRKKVINFFPLEDVKGNRLFREHAKGWGGELKILYRP